MDTVERILMHGDVPVARLSVLDGLGIVDKVLSVERPEHMPLGTMVSLAAGRRRRHLTYRQRHPWDRWMG